MVEERFIRSWLCKRDNNFQSMEGNNDQKYCLACQYSDVPV